MAAEATTLEVPGPNGVREMRVSSPSRVLWPELGITNPSSGSMNRSTDQLQNALT